ncbi:MAG: HAMP domain-containing protein [Bacteroidota bacterium]
MKTSIRTKFILGIVFFFLIIALLALMSAYQLNKLSNKTSSILKENHFSVVFAQNMSEELSDINQEISTAFLTNKVPDGVQINRSFRLFERTLKLEKNNITESGEDKLVINIESSYNNYRDSLVRSLKNNLTVAKVVYLQKEFSGLDHQLFLLSQINEKAIEFKTNATSISAKNALQLMSIVASLCFIITLGFTASFASYFNDRFSQLYQGIKEIASSNYGQRLHFDGNDEFYEISLIFNEMAQKLSEEKQNPNQAVNIEEFVSEISMKDDVKDLKRTIEQMKNLEQQAVDLIAKFEEKK